MSVTFVVTVTLLNIYFGFLVMKSWKDTDGLWKRWRFLLFPVIFPTVLVNLALYSKSVFLPILFAPVLSFGVVAPFLVLIGLALLQQSTIPIEKRLGAVEISPEVAVEVFMSRNKLFLAAGYAAIKAAHAGVVEEFWFRYLTLMSVQVVMLLFMPVLGVSLGTALQSLPWLTLSIGPASTPIVFTSLFVINLVFAVLHGIDPRTWRFSSDLIVRMILAWFMSWVIALALLEAGLLGAILVHFMADFIIFLPILYLKFTQPSPF